MTQTSKQVGQDTTTKPKAKDANDSQAVNKKIAERLAYFNKLSAKEKGEPEDTEE
jgi:hypothetical protein